MGLTFDSVARSYRQFRPGYPDALFDRLDSVVDLEGVGTVLEIGCGTG